jgi:hypothetical protein
MTTEREIMELIAGKHWHTPIIANIAQNNAFLYPTIFFHLNLLHASIHRSHVYLFFLCYFTRGLRVTNT